MDETDPDCLSYWFPKLEAAGVPVPRTEIVHAPDRGVDLIHLCDGKTPPRFDELCAAVRASADRFGYPCFLRTGQGSGKHEWKETCYVGSPDVIPERIARLVNWSHTVYFFGLSTDVFAVREMLPTRPLATLPAYGDFPLVREIRGFVRDGRVQCWHPYWPTGAVRDGWRTKDRPADADRLAASAQTFTSDELAEIDALLARVAAAFTGGWSVDVLETDRGWYVTDMAIAERSYHWPGCEFGPPAEPEEIPVDAADLLVRAD